MKKKKIIIIAAIVLAASVGICGALVACNGSGSETSSTESKVDESTEGSVESEKVSEEFGRLLNYTWMLKRGITDKISTDSIDSVYAAAIKAGAVGGKLLGAGGGGFLLFYVEPEKQAMVHKALDKLLYVPFQFETSGTQVIHYTPESYVPRE